MAPDFLTHSLLDLPNIQHGFFGRKGGYSTGVYASLNCGLGTDDDKQAVAKNRHAVAAAMGVKTLVTAAQYHSADVLVLKKTPDMQPRCDGLITSANGFAIGALAADCMTVLFADSHSGLIGAAHAGWRGALSGVLENTVRNMVSAGARCETIRAVFGPCLRPPDFEVGKDLLQAFTSKTPKAEEFFTPEKTSGKYQLDIVAYGRLMLEQEGLDPAHIGDIGHSTLAEPDQYFSYRHARANSNGLCGRHIATIARK
jgi:purine-nucleoside/S-methyl-5'-thioadenosine phosphorylase / adenosine deaminase